MTNDKRKELLDKIRKLNAKAKGTNNEAEAAAFSAKVAELCAEYNLSLDEAERAEYGDINKRNIDMMYLDPWRRNIWASCASLYFCKIWLRNAMVKGKVRPSLGLAGSEVNMDVCQSMAEYLIETTVRLAREYSRGDRKAALGFERGCGERLAIRVYQMYLDAKKVADKPTGTGTALVALYNAEEERVTQAVQKHLAPNLRPSTGLKGSSFNDHSAHGRAAAETVGLNTQIRSNSNVGGLLK